MIKIIDNILSALKIYAIKILSLSRIKLYKIIIVFVLFFPFSCLYAANNHVVSLTVSQSEGSFEIKPQLDFKTSTDIKEAIDNGIRVQLIVKAQLYQPSSLWFDKVISQKKINLEFSYFILSKIYVVKNTDTEEQLGFNEYENLWKEFEKLAIMEFTQQSNNNIWVRFRIVLDKGALPTAMQLPVIFNDNWDINTEWYQHKVK